jgi:putative transposase
MDNPKYNPKIHHRRSIRLKGYDYSQAGAYFITICCANMECRFGKIENNEMILNEYGIIAFEEWMKLTERFTNFELDTFQIMPNHIHGIIVLKDIRVSFTSAEDVVGAGFTTTEEIVGAGFTPAQDDKRAGASPAPTSAIIGAYKSLVANECLKIFKTKNEIMGKLWQRDYFEHIIRNEASYKNISDYIITNAACWKDDKFYR